MKIEDKVDVLIDSYNTEELEYTIVKDDSWGVVVEIGGLRIDISDIERILENMRYLQKRVETE